MKKPTKQELDQAFKTKRDLMNKALERYMKSEQFDPIKQLNPEERKKYEQTEKIIKEHTSK